MLKSLSKLYRLFQRRDHAKLAGIFGMMFVASFLEVLGIGMIPLFVVAVSAPDNLLQYPILGDFLRAVNIDTAEDLVVYGAILLLAVFVTKNLYLGFFTYIKNRFIADRGVHLENRVFKAYMASPYTFYISRNSAELLRNVSSETIKIVQGIMLPFMELTLQVLMSVLILATLLLLEPVITVVTALFLGGVGGFFLRFTRKRVQEYGVEDREARMMKIKAVYQGLGGLKATRVLNREHHFLDAYAEWAERSKAATIYSNVVGAIPRFINETLAVSGILLIAAIMVLDGRPVTGIIPVLALFGAATMRLLPALNTSISQITKIQYNAPAVDAVYDDLILLEGRHRKDRIEILREAPPRLELQDRISIRDLSYHYPGQQEGAVVNVSLEVPRGHAVALVGHSGAGKTTLADLILGLLVPESGTIRVDGVDIRTNTRGWQQNVGYIPQQVYLIDDTIVGNIAFGVPEDEIDMEQVDAAIEAAQLGELIQMLPAGRNTRVGERGVRLSVGQQQRVGIARALYGNPQVLVMDEATSALDNLTERFVIDAIEQLRGDRTIITIAHRLTTVEKCDTIFFMKNGAIVAHGSYQKLLRENMEFRRMSLVDEEGSGWDSGLEADSRRTELEAIQRDARTL
jgi:ATP-binding cassette, subfamily B, bacterial PglK